MTDTSLMNAGINDSIVPGNCIMIDDGGEICYGGPIKGAPDAGGKLVLLNSQDFEKLKRAVERKRH